MLSMCQYHSEKPCSAEARSGSESWIPRVLRTALRWQRLQGQDWRSLLRRCRRGGASLSAGCAGIRLIIQRFQCLAIRTPRRRSRSAAFPVGGGVGGHFGTGCCPSPEPFLGLADQIGTELLVVGRLPTQGSTQRRRTIDDKLSSFQKRGDAAQIMLCCF